VTPHQGQGASQALEDAEALGAFLRDASRASAPEALHRTFRARYKRASFIQARSHARGLGHVSDGAEDARTMGALWAYHGVEAWEKEGKEMVLSVEEEEALLRDASA
jgi:salicylate hydroxylase